MSAVASLFPPQGQDEIDGPILLAILRLLQDDDAQIRKEAETAAQLYIQTPIKSHQGIAAQKIAARLFGMKSASSLIEESLLQPIGP